MILLFSCINCFPGVVISIWNSWSWTKSVRYGQQLWVNLGSVMKWKNVLNDPILCFLCHSILWKFYILSPTLLCIFFAIFWGNFSQVFAVCCLLRMQTNKQMSHEVTYWVWGHWKMKTIWMCFRNAQLIEFLHLPESLLHLSVCCSIDVHKQIKLFLFTPIVLQH